MPDLMAALKASLDAVRGDEGDASKPKSKPKAQADDQGAGRRLGLLPQAHDGEEGLAARAARVRPRGDRRRGIELAAHPPAAGGLHRARASTAVRRGRGFAYVDDRRASASPRTEVLGAHPRARHPARVGGRVDLPVPRRPHPGDRHRRARPQAVPLPPEVARVARPREVRGHGRVRARAADAARARRRRPGARRPVAASTSSPRATRLLDRGFFRIGSEDYAVTNETYGLATMRKSHVPPARRPHRLRLPGQARQAPRPVGRRPGGRRGRRGAQAPPRRRRRSCWPTSAGGAGSTCARRTSTSTSRRATGLDVSAKDFRTWGATVLAAVGARRRGAERRLGQDREQARDDAGRSRRSRTTWATRRPSRARPTSTRGSSTASPRATRSARCWSEIADDVDATAIQGPVEEAVLDLLEGPRSSESVERVSLDGVAVQVEASASSRVGTIVKIWSRPGDLERLGDARRRC